MYLSLVHFACVNMHLHAGVGALLKTPSPGGWSASAEGLVCECPWYACTGCGGELGRRKCCWLLVEVPRIVFKTQELSYEKGSNFQDTLVFNWEINFHFSLKVRSLPLGEWHTWERGRVKKSLSD